MSRPPQGFLGPIIANALASGKLETQDKAELHRLQRIQAEAERAKYRVVLTAILREQMLPPAKN